MAKTNEKASVKYVMRNDNVLVKKLRVEQVRGLFMPEASMEGCQFVVQAVGPAVKDLQVGDTIFFTGKMGEDTGILPNDSTLFVTKEKNVLLVMKPNLEE